MQLLQEAGYVRPQLVKLSLDDYQVNGGSIGCGRDGTTFAFTLGPISDAAVAALEDVAHQHGKVCLYCCGQPLLFDLLTLERKESRKVRIVGRIIGGQSAY